MNNPKYSSINYNGKNLILMKGMTFSTNELRSRLHQMEINFNINERKKEILAASYDTALQSKENQVKIIDKILYDTKCYIETSKPQRMSCPTGASNIAIKTQKVPVLNSSALNDPILSSYNQNMPENKNVFLSDKVNIIAQKDFNTSFGNAMNSAQLINVNNNKQLNKNNKNVSIFTEYVNCSNRQQSHSPIRDHFMNPAFNQDASTNIRPLQSDFDMNKKAQITHSTNIAPFEANVSVIQNEEQSNLRNNLQPKPQENPFANNCARIPFNDTRRFNDQGYIPNNNSVLTDTLTQEQRGPVSIEDEGGLVETISKNRDTFVYGGLLSAIIVGVGYFVVFRNGRAILDFIKTQSAAIVKFPGNACSLLFQLIKQLVKGVFYDKLYVTIPLIVLGIIIYFAKKKYDEKQLIQKIFNEFKEELKANKNGEISQEEFILKYANSFQININKFRKYYLKKIEKLRKNDPNIKYCCKSNMEGKDEIYYSYQD